jgi:hypothetical protein
LEISQGLRSGIAPKRAWIFVHRPSWASVRERERAAIELAVEDENSADMATSR